MKSFLFILLASGLQSFAIAQQTDLEIVVQLALDLDEIQHYYHREAPRRLMVKILDNGVIPNTLRLEKFGAPVEFLEKSLLFTLGYSFFVQFEEVNLSSNAAKLEYFLFGEGVSVSIELAKKEDNWEIISKQITEK